MSPTEFEAIYERLARHIDRLEERSAEVYLAKVVLLMAHHVGDAETVRACIDEAARTAPPRPAGSSHTRAGES